MLRSYLINIYHHIVLAFSSSFLSFLSYTFLYFPPFLSYLSTTSILIPFFSFPVSFRVTILSLHSSFFPSLPNTNTREEGRGEGRGDALSSQCGQYSRVWRYYGNHAISPLCLSSFLPVSFFLSHCFISGTSAIFLFLPSCCHSK